MSFTKIWSDRTSDNYHDSESGVTLRHRYTDSRTPKHRTRATRFDSRAGLTIQVSAACETCAEPLEIVYSQGVVVPATVTSEQKAAVRAAIVSAQAAYLKAFDAKVEQGVRQQQL